MKKFLFLCALCASVVALNATEKAMTPTHGFLSWDAPHSQWGLVLYESENFYCSLVVDGNKENLPLVMSLTGADDDNNLIVAFGDETFGGKIKDAELSISYESGEILFDSQSGIHYIWAKVSGEASAANGDKMTVNEPADFIRLTVSDNMIPAEERTMTPTHGFLSWSESKEMWGIVLYEYDGEDPKFYCSFSAAAALEPLPTALAVYNSTDDDFLFVEFPAGGGEPDFAGIIENAELAIEYKTGEILHDDVENVDYVLAKVSGEATDPIGNKMIVAEPADFISLFVSGLPTAIDQLNATQGQSKKVIRDGQIYILRDGKTYNALGTEVK